MSAVSAALTNATPEQVERMLVIFDMLISLFERAYLVAYKPKMSDEERRRWKVIHKSMRSHPKASQWR